MPRAYQDWQADVLERVVLRFGGSRTVLQLLVLPDGGENHRPRAPRHELVDWALPRAASTSA